VLPWYEFKQSPGAPVAPESGSNETADPEDQYYLPFRMTGDLSDEDRQAGVKRVAILGWITVAATGLLLITLVLEIAIGTMEGSRWPLMASAFLGFVATCLALAWTYYQLPGALAHEGVTKAFTHYRADGDVIRTTVGWGFIAASLSLAMTAAFVAFKFATGLQDPAAVQEFVDEDPD